MLHENADKHLALALRSVWLSPGSAAYLGSLSAMRAKSVAAFGASLSAWGAPPVNHVCADVGGDIGWFTAGFAPVRPNWHGLLPVPGDGSHEWAGFIAAEDLPRSINPAAGFVATANEFNLPADRDAAAPTIGHEWQEGSRAERIKSVLDGDMAHSTAASMALQNDISSRPAALICELLGAAAEKSDITPAQARAAALLEGWDFGLAAESGAAALFEVWWMKHLRPALLARLVPDPTVRALLLPGDIGTMLAALQAPDNRFGPDAGKARDAMLLETLVAGFEECARRLGADPSRWKWGDLHQAVFEHPASRVRQDAGDSWDVGPLAVGGSRSTPMAAGYRLGDFRVITGATVRLVMDVGDWDKSFCINTPGQSGDPRSPHYADLAESWSTGRYVPLLYSDARITEATDDRILLLPPSRPR